MRRVGWVLALLAFAGCEQSTNGNTSIGSQQDLQQSLCRIRQVVDADCDRVLDAYDRHPGQNDWLLDTDRDGAVDPVDRFVGDDFGDLDNDGWANWADVAPYNAHQTIADLLSFTTARQYVDHERNRLINEARRLDNANAARDVLMNELNRQSRDRDSDTIPDIYDTQPSLRYDDDYDGDSVYNGRDRLPYDDDYS